MTLTQLTNEVLKALREDTVSSYTNTAYSQLVARLVNVAKRQVENAWNWIALRHNETVVAADSTDKTVANTNHYTRILRAYNTTKRCWVKPVSWLQAVEYNNKDTIETGDITGYRVKSRTAAGVFSVEFFPKPADSQNIVFELCTPSAYLTDDLVEPKVDDEIIIAATIPLAIAERGDDNGEGVATAYKRYNDLLGDAISIEESLLEDEATWK